MLLMELAIEICIRNHLLATSGYHTLYEWYRKAESEHFPDPTGLGARLEHWTFGLYPACIKYLMSAFDIPEVMAVIRTTICRKGMEPLQMSHRRRFPSKWRAGPGWSEPTSTVRVVDQFVIPRMPADPTSLDSAAA